MAFNFLIAKFRGLKDFIGAAMTDIGSIIAYIA